MGPGQEHQARRDESNCEETTKEDTRRRQKGPEVHSQGQYSGSTED